MEKKVARLRRAKRTRLKMKELQVERLVVNRTPRHIYAQVISADNGKVLASGKITELKESDDETLEDVFIRLVGHSMAEAQGLADGDLEEE